MQSPAATTRSANSNPAPFFSTLTATMKSKLITNYSPPRCARPSIPNSLHPPSFRLAAARSVVDRHWAAALYLRAATVGSHEANLGLVVL